MNESKLIEIISDHAKWMAENSVNTSDQKLVESEGSLYLMDQDASLDGATQIFTNNELSHWARACHFGDDGWEEKAIASAVQEPVKSFKFNDEEKVIYKYNAIKGEYMRLGSYAEAGIKPSDPESAKFRGAVSLVE